ncbi:MAG: LruC domain-containing protein [Spirochaetia bacterium]|nr:LruC domain-containing protein [Spirochaetia bacterium]
MNGTNQDNAPVIPQAFDLQVDTGTTDPSIIADTDRVINVEIYIDSHNQGIDADLSIFTPLGDTLFNVKPAQNGNLKGTFVLKEGTSTTLIVDALVNGVQKKYEIDIKSANIIVIRILLSPDKSQDPDPDSDGDGVPDSEDDYKDDPERSEKVKFPSGNEFYTVSFETHKDIFKDDKHKSNHEDHDRKKSHEQPKKKIIKGDSVNPDYLNKKTGYKKYSGKFHNRDDSEDYFHSAEVDFNDYVVQLAGEVDYNAAGKAVRLRMKVQHVAGGAAFNKEHDYEVDDSNSEHEFEKFNDYNHKYGKSCGVKNLKKGFYLKLNLPAAASYTMLRSQGPDNALNETSGDLNEISAFEILPSSRETLNFSNTTRGSVYVPGMVSEVEFIFNEPVDPAVLGDFPYDLYLSYKNGRKEIHFPGFVTDSYGNDLYLTEDGFRWALLIEGEWKWPFEHVNINKAYTEFYGWYTGDGSLNSDWYLNPDYQNVFLK